MSLGHRPDLKQVPCKVSGRSVVCLACGCAYYWSFYWQAALAQQGVIEAILDAMRPSANDKTLHPEAHASCLRALSNLAGHAPNKDLMAESGGMEVIVELLKLHPRHAGVQEKGSSAVVQLASNSASNQAAFAAAGGMRVFIDSLRFCQKSRVSSVKSPVLSSKESYSHGPYLRGPREVDDSRDECLHGLFQRGLR